MTERLVVKNIGQCLTMCGEGAAELEIIEKAALVVEGGKFAWVGEEKELPACACMEGRGNGRWTMACPERSRRDDGRSGNDIGREAGPGKDRGQPQVPAATARVVDAEGRVVMPGLVECHTHLVFAGDRAAEFALRSRGVSYEEIAAQGGGILSTVRATRAAGTEELLRTGIARLDRFLEQGVTTVEIKSGYGLDTETEIRLLSMVRSLQEQHAVQVVPTFLGAHVVAPEFRPGDRQGYVDLVCREMIPEVARQKLAVFCDVFCEEGAFTPDESRRILETGRQHGLVPKIHAEQLSHRGGCRVAAELRAASADHLDFAGKDDAEALAAAGVTAVFLPGATFFTGKKRYPDARLFARAGATMALSTDFNPGSSNTMNLWLVGTMACTQMGMAPAAALRAMTAGAAAALRMQDRAGTIAVGRRADFLILEDSRWESILDLFGHNPVRQVFVAGREAGVTAGRPRI